MSADLPTWAYPIITAAGPIEPGVWTVVAWPDGGQPWRIGAYATPAAAQGQATRVSRGDVRAYLVQRHAAGVTVYLDAHTILGTTQAAPELPEVTWRYLLRGAVKHALLLDGNSTTGHRTTAVCGVASDWRWHGTGAQHDRVAQLPECRNCARTRARRP